MSTELRLGATLLLPLLFTACSSWPPARSCSCASAQPLEPVSWSQQGTELLFVRGDTVMAVFEGVQRVEEVDITGDSHKELVVLWAPGEEPDARRIWVVRPTPHGVQPVWRGSAMSSPVQDFRLVQTPQGTCLVTLERPARGQQAVVYRWTGFGFGADPTDRIDTSDPQGTTWSVRCLGNDALVEFGL